MPSESSAPVPGASADDPPSREDRGRYGREHRHRRWFSYQPNVPGRGIVAGYSSRFWLLVAVIGVAAGAGASAMMALLKLTEHLAYGYAHGPYLDGVQVGSGRHRVVVLLLAGVIVAAGAVVLHRLPSSGGTEVSEALWLGEARLPFVASIARGVLSIITVAMGVSLGREGAPQLAGAATASWLAQWAQLPQWQRRLLVASGAGAGFAAVYNVPLGGALFALEVLLGTVALPLVLPALAVSVIATAVAWITLGTGHTYHLPTYNLHPGQMVWAALAGPVIGVMAVIWVKMVQRANALRPRAWGRYVAPVIAFGLLGVVSIQYPQLLGNGKGTVQLALLGEISLGLFVVLLALKPLATAMCLGVGSPGGLFTPTLTVGVLLAGVLEGVWSHVWPGTVPGGYALIGGAAFLAAAIQGPLSALVLVLELGRHFDLLMAPALVAVTEATVVARRLGAPSIYSARLEPDPYGAGERTAAAAIATLDAPALQLPDGPEPRQP
jgi:CIC family chloride channel protein